MLNIFSTARSLSGIYRELRQLRRMAESYFDFAGIPLPRSAYDRLKERISGPVTEPEPEPQLSEEEVARKAVKKVVSDLAAGRDPGTDYRPWY